MVAPAFVISLLAAAPLVHRFGAVGAIHLMLYAIVNVGVSLLTAARSHWRFLPVLPLIFLIIHLAWGTGFLSGICYWPFVRRSAA